MKYLPYSFSKIETFNYCKFKFKLQYIDKIKVDIEKSDSLKKGSYFHFLIENFCKGKTEQECFDIDYQIEENLKIQTQRIFISSLKGIVGKYINSEEDFTIIGNELSFGLDIKYDVCNYYSKKAIFRGFIDLIVKSKKENEFYIIDFKTGKYKQLEYQSFKQLQLYSIWFFKMFPKEEIVNLSFVYPEANLENTLKVERKYLKNMISIFSQNVKLIETEEEFSKTENTKLCEFCDFKKIGIC